MRLLNVYEKVFPEDHGFRKTMKEFEDQVTSIKLRRCKSMKMIRTSKGEEREVSVDVAWPHNHFRLFPFFVARLIAPCILSQEEDPQAMDR